MTEFPDIIQDGDIELRIVKPTFDNARELFLLIDENRAHLSRFLNWVDSIKVPEDEFGTLERWQKNKSNWLIFQDGKMIGSCGFAHIDKSGKIIELGAWIIESCAGCGIVTRAVKLLEKEIFKSGDWHRIEIRCDVDNKASMRVPEKLGYKLDGILREEYPLNGELRSTMVWSKLEQEYK
jgi:ribosomal-protein-serine acetyltransferase